MTSIRKSQVFFISGAALMHCNYFRCYSIKTEGEKKTGNRKWLKWMNDFVFSLYINMLSNAVGFFTNK